MLQNRRPPLYGDIDNKTAGGDLTHVDTAPDTERCRVDMREAAFGNTCAVPPLDCIINNVFQSGHCTFALYFGAAATHDDKPPKPAIEFDAER